MISLRLSCRDTKAIVSYCCGDGLLRYSVSQCLIASSSLASFSSSPIVSSLRICRILFSPQIQGHGALPSAATHWEWLEGRELPKRRLPAEMSAEREWITESDCPLRGTLGGGGVIAGDATFSVAQWAGRADPSRAAQFFAGIIGGRQINRYRNVAFAFAIGAHLGCSTFAHAALFP